MSRRIVPTVLLAATVLFAACSSDDGPTATTPDTEVSVPSTDEIDFGSGETCITHPELIFVDIDRAEEAAALDGTDAVRLTNDQLIEELGVEADDQAVESIGTVLERIAVFDSPEPTVDIRVINAALSGDTGQPVAGPVHAVGFAGHWRFAPATPPQAATADINWSTAESDIDMIVLDTGYVATDVNEMERVVPLTDGVDDESSTLDPRLRGHGMFIASVILQQMATDVTMVRLGATASPMIDHGGQADFRSVLSDELQLFFSMARIVNALDDRDGRYQLNLSAGTYACTGLDALGVRAAVDLWNDSGLGPEIVAAAGNDALAACVFVPAAFEDVVGVGAADASGNRASFSNDGDVIAPGVDVLGIAPGQAVGPLVTWSGTSFAAPSAAVEVAAQGDLDAFGDTTC